MAGRAVVAEDRLAQLDRSRVPRDLVDRPPLVGREGFFEPGVVGRLRQRVLVVRGPAAEAIDPAEAAVPGQVADAERDHQVEPVDQPARSEEHTSELQSLMRTSYAVFC